ncbi:MAG TPA: AIR synthase related protein, partial [Propionicimonas sp.]
VVRRIRDLLILDDTLVIAADSIGGIGPKPSDTVSSDARTVAHFALRVPLLEVLCAGARPIAVIDNLCVELEPTGVPMIEEIRRLAAEAGVAPLAVTGSTEENVATQATGIGVTVIGRIGPGGLLSGGSRSGDVVICAGLPLSAPHDQVWIGHPDQLSVATALAVIACGLVHDALPVGSKGLAWEVAQLAQSAELEHEWLDATGVSITASGGPASCVLFSCNPDSVGPSST